MQTWLAGLLVTILSKVGSYWLAEVLTAIHGTELKEQTDSDVDNKLQAFKNAYKEAFNGKPVTDDQKQKLKMAISNFIRNDSGGL